MTDVSQYSDRQLADALRSGNEYVFAEIWKRYHRIMYALAFKYLKDSDSAQDAVQHVFLKLWEQRKVLLINLDLKSYIFMMLRNHLLNEIRHNNTILERNYVLAQNQCPEEEDISRHIEKAETRRRLLELIESLPPQKRTICKLKLNEELSNQEIAERMGITTSTVKSHYTEALKFIRANIGKLSIILLAVSIFKIFPHI